jgi:hypothetical protein
MDEPRAESACDSCGAIDSEPRHHIAYPDPGSAEGGMAVISRHFACCAADGCPDGSCDKILKEQGRAA